MNLRWEKSNYILYDDIKYGDTVFATVKPLYNIYQVGKLCWVREMDKYCTCRLKFIIANHIPGYNICIDNKANRFIYVYRFTLGLRGCEYYFVEEWLENISKEEVSNDTKNTTKND